MQRALQDAAANHTLLSATADFQPLAGTPPLPAAQLADDRLHLVRHKDSGCVQFIFPGAPATAAPALSAQGWDWMMQAMIERIEAHSKPERLLALRHGYGQGRNAG